MIFFHLPSQWLSDVYTTKTIEFSVDIFDENLTFSISWPPIRKFENYYIAPNPYYLSYFTKSSRVMSCSRHPLFHPSRNLYLPIRKVWACSFLSMILNIHSYWLKDWKKKIEQKLKFRNSVILFLHSALPWVKVCREKLNGWELSKCKIRNAIWKKSLPCLSNLLDSRKS